VVLSLVAEELIDDPGTQTDANEEAGELKQTGDGDKIPGEDQSRKKCNDFLHLAIKACSGSGVKRSLKMLKHPLRSAAFGSK
jgi:hypothetical protein